MNYIEKINHFLASERFISINDKANKVFLGFFFFIFGIANFSILYNTLGFILIFFVVKEIYLLFSNKKKVIFFLLLFISLFFLLSYFLFLLSPSLEKKVVFSIASIIPGIPFLILVIFKKILLSNKQRAIYLIFFLFNFWFYITFFFRKIDIHPSYYLEIINHKTYNYFFLVSALIIFFNGTKITKKHVITFFLLSLSGFLLSLINIYFQNFKSFPEYLSSPEFDLKHFFLSGDFRLATPYRVVITLSLFFSQYIIFLLYMVESSKNRKNNYLYLIIILILSISLFINWSKFNIVVSLFLLVLWAVFLSKKRIYQLFLLLVVAISFFLMISDNAVSKRVKNSVLVFTNPEKPSMERSVSTRYYLYEIGIKNFEKFPFTGTGAFTFGDYLTYHPDYYSKLYPIVGKTASPHSDAVDFLSNNGIIGFLLYYGLMAWMLFFFIKKYLQTKNLFFLALALGLINFFSNGLTDSNLKSTEVLMMSFYVTIFFYYKKFFKLNAPSS